MRSLLWLAPLLFSASCDNIGLANEIPDPGLSGSSGLPCDVDGILQASCRSCHGAVPTANAPMSLMTYDDLVAPAPSDPSKTVAAVSVTRMADLVKPMPPTPDAPVSASDQSLFAAWVAAGSTQGDCAAQGPDPLNAAPVCTSGQYSNANEGSTMAPGQACIDCHTTYRGPRFSLAGTVFPTGHEPDDCVAAGISTARVVITDAANRKVTIAVNSVGNFSSRTAVTLPYTAQVTYNGKVRNMATPQMSGDCNSCHTQNGDMKAPGRITLPAP